MKNIFKVTMLSVALLMLVAVSAAVAETVAGMVSAVNAAEQSIAIKSGESEKVLYFSENTAWTGATNPSEVIGKTVNADVDDASGEVLSVSVVS